jgi:AraC family transcriptional regulator
MSEGENNRSQNSHLRPGQFYGEVIKKRQCSGLLMSELRHPTGRRLPRHSHELAYFCLLLGGGYAEYLGRRTLTYKPLTVMFHPPELTHSDEIGYCGGHFFSVEMERQWLESLRDYSFVPDAVTEARGGDLGWLSLRLYREFREPGTCSPLAVEGLVMTMLAEVASAHKKREKKRPSWLVRAVELLHEEFPRRLTLSRVATEVGVHPFHLSRVFRQTYNQTVGEYVNQLCVQFACRKLADPEARLTDVALAAGFADQSHFTRVFKQVTGMTPGVFRASLREKNAAHLRPDRMS